MEPTKYRKKPVEIEVVEYDGSNADEVTAWFDGYGTAGYRALDDRGEHLIVYTRGGVRRVDPGDFVLLTADGFEVATAEVFASMYESDRVELTDDLDVQGHKVFVGDEAGSPWVEMVNDATPLVRMRLPLLPEDAVTIAVRLLHAAGYVTQAGNVAQELGCTDA